jgi:hypothetical protein
MPELVHTCGKRVRFPSGTEGRRGRCPHCGESVLVPEESAVERVTLDPPPDWAEYQAYLEDKGPQPAMKLMPSKIMLKTDADAAWERQAEVRPSKFSCPACKARINMDQVLCIGCGVDFRSGKVMGGTARLNDKGMAYLEQIPWLDAARRDAAEEGEGEVDGAGRPKRKVRRRKLG